MASVQSTTPTERWMTKGRKVHEAPFGDGAAVAEPSGADPFTPIKAKRGDVKLRWDFDGAWEGVITKGPHKGKSVSCKVANLTEKKWAAAAKVHKYDVAFEKATFQEKKTAARHFLELHVQGLSAEGHLL